MNDFFDQRRRPGEPGQRMERREESRRRRRRRRLLTLAVVVLAAAAVALALWRPWSDGAAASRPAGSPPSATPSASSGLASTASPAASAASGSPAATASPEPASPGTAAGLNPSTAPGQAQVVAPPIVLDLVPYGPAAQGRDGGLQPAPLRSGHRGSCIPRPSCSITPRRRPTPPRTDVFASNAPVLGELPGVAAHFVIDENGTIYQQVPLDVRCRHAIGLDWCAIGIEFVQPATSGPAQAIAQIFARHPPARRRLAPGRLAAGRLRHRRVERDRPRHGQRLAAVQGPARRRNDHVDWNAAAMARFRQAPWERRVDSPAAAGRVPRRPRWPSAR